MAAKGQLALFNTQWNFCKILLLQPSFSPRQPPQLTKTPSCTSSPQWSLCPLSSLTHLYRFKNKFIFSHTSNNITKIWFPYKHVSFFLREEKRTKGAETSTLIIFHCYLAFSPFDLKLAWIFSTTYNPSFWFSFHWLGLQSQTLAESLIVNSWLWTPEWCHSLQNFLKPWLHIPKLLKMTEILLDTRELFSLRHLAYFVRNSKI